MSIRNPNFYSLLLHIDQDFAEQAPAQRCRCGGVPHSARYPRKPRGLPDEMRSGFDFRYSFCCADCRCRTTPLSVRFLGRRVYVAAIMVVVSATRAQRRYGGSNASARCAGRAPPSTIARWRHWWTTGFVSSPFWALGQAMFVPPVVTAQMPASLLERFVSTPTAEPLLCLLRWLSPLTSGSAVSSLREGR